MIGTRNMKCTHPIYGYIEPSPYLGESPRLKFLDKKAGELPPLEYPELKLPCRKCMPCRISQAGTWTVRLMHEAQSHETPPYFVTLTYNDENLPISLDHNDYQLFMKRLRKAFLGNKIRYFMCGEYGEQTYRPHYHAIIYGVHLHDLERYCKNQNGDQLYNSKKLTDLWGLGHVVIGYANKSSMAYTAGYMLKEQFKKSKDGSYKYERCDPETGEIIEIERPYIRMSNRPGIGKEWFNKYKSDILKGFVTVEGKKQGVPDYYIRKLEEESPDLFQQVQEMREQQKLESLVKASEWEAETGESWNLYIDRAARQIEEMRIHKNRTLKPLAKNARL